MGKPVSKNAQKSKETVFNVSNELKEAEVWRNKPGSGKEDPLQKEKQSYLDQMILASKDDNLKLIHIAERKLKNVNKADFNPYKPPKEFSQKLPTGSKDIACGAEPASRSASPLSTMRAMISANLGSNCFPMPSISSSLTSACVSLLR